MLNDKKKIVRKKDWVKAVVFVMVEYMLQIGQEMGNK